MEADSVCITITTLLQASEAHYLGGLTVVSSVSNCQPPSNLKTASSRTSPCQPRWRQYLYFCTSKARKMRIYLRPRPAALDYSPDEL